MKIGYIGSGPISNFHIPALEKNGLTISAIGTTKDSKRCLEIARKFNLENKYCKGGWEEVSDKDLDAYIICVEINETFKILEHILSKNKPILVEKPVNYTLSPMERILNHSNVDNIFVGYNRRFYETTNQLKTYCEISKGGTITVNIPDSVLGIKNIIGNACHMIDLTRYLIGEFKILNKIVQPNLENTDIEYFSALCRNDKWTILFNAHSLIPSNFSISVNSGKNVFEMKPIEKLSVYEGMNIIEPTPEEPLRKYVPKLKFSKFEDSSLKPGFDNMYKNFKLFVEKKKSNNCSFEDAYKTLKYCWKFIESDTSKHFNFN